MLKFLLRGGLVVDGTGNPGYFADVGIDQAGNIDLFRGRHEAAAERVIDVSGLVIAPGFIDMHAHSALSLLNDRKHEAKILQGVTTEVIGVDGNSYAPFENRHELERFATMNSGLDGRATQGYDWTTVEEYLDRYNGVACNVAYLVGNSPLRIGAVGWEQRPAVSSEIDHMRSSLREAMEQGAWGLSTGLDYPPGSYASTEELIALSGTAAQMGGIYHTHMRYGLGDRFLDPIAEACAIGRAAGLPVHLTHLYHRRSAPGTGAQDMLSYVESQRQQGLDVTFDCFPYIHGSTRLSISLPQWVQADGPEAVLDKLNRADVRARLRQEILPHPRADTWDEVWLTALSLPDTRDYDGWSIGAIARARSVHPVDVICDMLIAEDLGVTHVTQAINGLTLPKFVVHPLAMIGSDGLMTGDYPSPRTYGTFPIVLSSYVREERAITLHDAVRRMTSFPAQRLGLRRRGVLHAGYAADIVVFDPERVGSTASQAHPQRPPEGIPYVFVNGALSVDKGMRTPASGGIALHRGKD